MLFLESCPSSVVTAAALLLHKHFSIDPFQEPALALVAPHAYLQRLHGIRDRREAHGRNGAVTPQGAAEPQGVPATVSVVVGLGNMHLQTDLGPVADLYL